LGNTYVKALLNQHTAHAALVFDPADLNPADMRRLSFIDLHWVPKPSSDDRVGAPPRNPAGRLCGDPTNVEGGPSVNSDEALALCRSHYPPYTLPTIATILQSWHDHSVAAGFDMRAGLLWKEDVRNAFGQITLDTDSAMRSCLLIPVPEPARANARAAGTPLPAYLVVILLWCCFGWCGASLAYGLLGGLIYLHIRGVDGPAISGVISTYVDDVAGFGHPSTVHADQAHARATITAILGPGGLADKSLLPCPAGEILG
jgi:hypothetical protein